jgi:hypothetical protein
MNLSMASALSGKRERWQPAIDHLCMLYMPPHEENSMLDYGLDKTSGILTLEPKGPLTVEDFKAITADVDGYLSDHSNLTGIMLTVAHVPGWASFSALVEHVKFVRDHQKRISRVAILTDNSVLKIPPQIAAHFAHPEFRVFGSADRGNAMNWLKGAQA